MSDEHAHVGDTGTVIELTITEDDVAVNISTATTKQIILRKPGASVGVAKTAPFTTTGADGKIKYTTIAADLDTAGEWSVQGYVVMPTGAWKSDVVYLSVLANL